MKDQADSLRRLMKVRTNRGVAENKVRILTVTSGKGGVGKTSITVNLAIALQNIGYRVLVVDADLGLGNVDIMLGISSRYNLSHVIFDDIDIHDAIVSGPSDIMILPGGSGLLELANISPIELNNLMRRLTNLNNIADIILIDTGAGLSNQNVDMILAANEAILVTTIDPTSLMDAYGMTKIVSSVDNKINFSLIMNMVEDTDAAHIAAKNLKKAGRHFLNIEISELGLIEDSSVVSKSVMAQSPFVLRYPHSKATRQIRSIADNLSDGHHEKTEMSIISYIDRLVKLLRIK